MSDTPETDTFALHGLGHLYSQEDFNFAANMERERDAARQELAEVKQAAREFIDAYDYEQVNIGEIKHNLERLVKQ